MLIDDRPKNIECWVNAGGIGILHTTADETIKQLNEITNWSDFYSTSMCRDLCFHSHENCYSLIEIKNMLEVSNLEFLGFTLSKDIRDKYLIENKDKDSLKDLALWDEFEKSNPYSFREMYQFWARKSIK